MAILGELMQKIPLTSYMLYLNWTYVWRTAFNSNCDDDELLKILDEFFEVMYMARFDFATIGFDSPRMDDLYDDFSRENTVQWKFKVFREAAIIFQKFHYFTTTGERAGKYVHRYPGENWVSTTLAPRFAERVREVEQLASQGLNQEARSFHWNGKSYDDLSDKMMKVLGYLHQCHASELGTVTSKQIKAATKENWDGAFVNQVFKLNRSDGPPIHPVAEVIESVSRGKYRLKVSESEGSR